MTALVNPALLAPADPGGAAKRRKPRWYIIYYVLAGFNLLTILATLSLSDGIVGLYVTSISTSRNYGETLGRLSELEQGVRATHAAANEAFETGKYDRAAERARELRERLQQGLAQARRDLAAHASGDAATELAGLEGELLELEAGGEQILWLLPQGQLAAAARCLARHGVHHDRALTLLDGLRKNVVAAKQADLEKQLERARFLEKCQYIILACVAFMVICVTMYGLSLARSIAEAEREREGYLKGLSLSESRARGVLEASLDAIVVVDHTGCITDFNPAAERTFCCPWTQVVGKSLVDLLLAPADRQEVRQAIAQYAEAKPGVGRLVGCRKEIMAQRADGVEFPAELAVTAIQHDGPTMFAASFRDLTEPRRLARRQELQHAVTRILAEIGTFAEAGPLILELLCSYLDWEMGVLWCVDEASGHQRCRQIWRRDAADAGALDAHCRDAIIAPGEGLVGKTYVSREPCWVTDVAAAPEFAQAAREELAGIRSAFCFPVMLGDKALGTLEFFSRRRLPPDEDLLRLAASLGIQLGQFIERERTLAQLRESDERFKSVTRATNDAVYDRDLASKTIWWNEAVATIFGYEPQDVDPAESWWVERIHPQERDRILTGIRQRLENGAHHWNGEYLFRRADGSYACVLDRGYVQYDADNRAVRMIGALHDFTHRKEAEAELLRYTQEVIAARDRIEKQAGELIVQAEQLRLTQARAEQANRLKSEFLANMSHEIRTPMNGILGMTDMALNTPLSAEQREYLETVKSSSDTLLSLINDILDFSKIEAGKLDLDPVDLPLRDTLVNVLRPLGARAHAKQLELACHVHADVPDWLVGDPVRLRQVVTNLVGNAIKFTEQGEVVVSVSLEHQPANPAMRSVKGGGPANGEPAAEEVTLLFTVRDTGIGIAADKLDMIFEPFTQADGSTTRRYGGTGLGLSICKRLVELMGGRIWVESRRGEGSEFFFTVRMAVSRSSKARLVLREPGCLHGMAALIVDDHETNRFILQEMLCGWGMRPATAAGGVEALAELRQAHAAGTPYPLVLVDFMMPEMDGVTLTRQIKDDSDLASSAVLMLTSGDPYLGAVNLRGSGVTGLLVKPVRPAELLTAILEAVGVQEGQASQQVEASLVSAAKPDAPATPLRILLAEDNFVNQKLTMRLLQKQGHTVLVANNGVEALELLGKEPIDLVLMDVQMPEMGGFEATAVIRSQEKKTGRHLPIVALTANAMKGDRERCLAAGFDGYVSKPIQLKLLLDAVYEAARQHPVALQPAALAAPSADVFDRAQALERAGGDEAFLNELIELFLEDAPKLMAEARTALAEEAAATVCRAAHTLKGAAGNFGSAATVASAKDLEMIGRSGDLTDAPPALARLELCLAQLQQALRAVLREAAGHAVESAAVV